MSQREPLIPENLAQLFVDFASQNPHKIALIEPLKWNDQQVTEEKKWTYAQFLNLVKTHQARLNHEGFVPGDRILVLLPASIQMYSLVAALFANGVVPVFIDPTMPRAQFLKALQNAAPKAVFSTEEFYKYRFLLPQLWRTRLYIFNRARLMLKNWDAINISQLDATTLPKRDPKSEALISFTTGSTGQPKAADRNLEIIHFQRELSRRIWTNGANDIEMNFFPMVVIANLVYGITTVLPAGNVSHLDQITTSRIADQIERHQVSRFVSPPSVLAQLLIHEEQNKNRFASVRRLVTGGAPVPKWLAEKTEGLFANSENHLVYGSTEAEPISHISFKEYLGTNGSGYLVGRPIPQLSVRIINLPQTHVIRSNIDLASHEQPTGQIGEIILNGPHVVKRYLFNQLDNQNTKLTDTYGNIWHRTGDRGYIDSSGNLWIVGRNNDRVQIEGQKLDVYPAEHDLENMIQSRAAIIQKKDLSIHVYLQINSDLLNQTQQKSIENTLTLFAPYKLHYTDKIPVDSRHRWKILREL